MRTRAIGAGTQECGLCLTMTCIHDTAADLGQLLSAQALDIYLKLTWCSKDGLQVTLSFLLRVSIFLIAKQVNGPTDEVFGQDSGWEGSEAAFEEHW